MSGALLKRELEETGAIPYRVGGRVRVAYTDGTKELVIEKMQKAVRLMARHIAEDLPEPDAEQKRKWHKAGLKQLDICDEPCPEGVLLTEVGVDWLVERCKRYHFSPQLNEAGDGLKFVPDDGWSMDDRAVNGGTISGVRSVCPRWFLDACKRRKQEIVDFLKRV